MIDLFGNAVQLLGMPISSAVLFLLAGMLLGHLLWYRDRGKNSGNDPELETRYLKIRGSLKQRKTQIKELQKQNDSITEDLTNLRQAHSTLRSKNKRLEQVSQSSQDEINQFRHSLNEAEIQLADEEKRNQTVIDQLQELIEKNGALTSESESRQDDFGQLDQQYRHCVSELEAAHSEIDNFRLQARTQQTDVDKQQNTIQELEQRIETQQQALNEANNALQQTQQDLVARCNDLDTLRKERDELEQQSQVHTKMLKQFEADLVLSKQIQTERDEFATDLSAAASSLSEQRQTLERCESEIELKDTKLRELQQQVGTAALQITEEQENRQQLEQFNAACQIQLAELEAQLSLKTAECEQFDVALKLAQEAHAESQKRIPVLNLELKQSNTKELAFRSKVAELQHLVQQQQQQITELCAIREEAVIHSLELEETRAQLVVETSTVAKLRKQSDGLNASRIHLETAQQTIQQYHERNSGLESLFVQQSDQLTELTHQARRVPKLELALKQSQAEIEQACRVIDQQKECILTAERICDETQCELTATIAEIHAMEIRIDSMSDDIISLSHDNALLTTVNLQAADQARQMELDQSQVSQQQFDECVAELRAVKQEREDLIGTRDNLEATISRLGNQITTHLTEARQISEVLSKTTVEHQNLEMALHAEVEARNTTIAELKMQLTSRSQQHDAVVDDLASKTNRLDQQRLEIQQLTTELETAKTGLAKKTQLKTEIDALEQALQSKSEQHDALAHALSLKNNEFDEQICEIERLSAELKNAESNRRERDLLKQEATEVRSQLACLHEELEDSLDANAKGQDRIREMENQLHDHVKKIRDLRRERSSSPAIQIATDAQKLETDSDRKAA